MSEHYEACPVCGRPPAAAEAAERSARVKVGLAKRKAAGLPIGRQSGAVDAKPRRRSGYVAAWAPGGNRRRAGQPVEPPEDASSP
jgi:hypothetical protein